MTPVRHLQDCLENGLCIFNGVLCLGIRGDDLEVQEVRIHIYNEYRFGMCVHRLAILLFHMLTNFSMHYQPRPLLNSIKSS